MFHGLTQWLPTFFDALLPLRILELLISFLPYGTFIPSQFGFVG